MHSRGRLRAGRPVFRLVHLSPHICTTVVPHTPCQRLETILSYYLIFRPALIHQSRQPHHPGLSVPQCSLPFSVGAERHSSRHLNSNATPPRPGFPSPAAPPPTSFPLMPTAPSAKDHLAPPHLEPTLSSSILSSLPESKQKVFWKLAPSQEKKKSFISSHTCSVVAFV